MSLEDVLDRFFQKFPNIKNQKSYAVAVSGGPDSMAMAHAISLYAMRENKTIFFMTVDHDLRPEAAKEAQYVEQWVVNQNNKLFSHVTLNWKGSKPDTALMETAREARYQLMTDYCVQHDIGTIFVAHHQDDQAETFLIRLSKGSGLDGLASMNVTQKYDDNLIIARPFLDIPKQDLIEYCKDQNIKYISDPSNENENYLRPRLRASMDVLEQEGLSAKRLTTLTKRLRRARQALEEIADQEYKNCLITLDENGILLDFHRLKELTEEIALRVLQLAVKGFRQNETYNIRMDKLENLFDSLWFTPDQFKPRTLGGLIFALKDKNSALYICKESS